MMYVALLRGINFGGNRKVSMAHLKKTFEALGFRNVVTYINSGNVVFSHTGKDQEKIVRKIEKGIQKDFLLEVKVLVRDTEDLHTVCKGIPVAWEDEPGMRPHVAFLWKEIDNPDTLKQVSINPKVDKVKYVAGALLWNVDLKNWNKSAMYKFVSTKITKQVTVRSVNTVRKLHQMMSIQMKNVVK